MVPFSPFPNLIQSIVPAAVRSIVSPPSSGKYSAVSSPAGAGHPAAASTIADARGKPTRVKLGFKTDLPG